MTCWARLASVLLTGPRSSANVAAQSSCDCCSKISSFSFATTATWLGILHLIKLHRSFLLVFAASVALPNQVRGLHGAFTISTRASSRGVVSVAADKIWPRIRTNRSRILPRSVAASRSKVRTRTAAGKPSCRDWIGTVSACSRNSCTTSTVSKANHAVASLPRELSDPWVGFKVTLRSRSRPGSDRSITKRVSKAKARCARFWAWAAWGFTPLGSMRCSSRSRTVWKKRSWVLVATSIGLGTEQGGSHSNAMRTASRARTSI
mmetsp:Transcript_119569/g.283961  ORF Transcript_119569/g.283961 Transcript_119569/m.283961 type:complete len:263 (+) Transcript_119569:377-1165(+)